MPIDHDAPRGDIVTGEARLRAALRETEAASPTRSTIDGDAIARRVRQRRLPKIIASGAVTTIAVLGLGTAAVQSIVPLLRSETVATDHAASESTTPEAAPGLEGGQSADSDATGMAPIVRCGEPIPDPSAPIEARGVQIELVVPDAATISDGAVRGDVVLTNTGDEVIRATAPLLPTAVLDDDGVVVWHTHGVIAQVVTDLVLAPGSAHRFTVTVEPLRCDNESELESGTAAPITAGVYHVVAVLDVTFNDGIGTRLISDPATIRLD